MRRGLRPLGLLLALLWTSAAFAATGQPSAVRYAPDRVIVKFKPTAGASKSSAVLRDLQASSLHRFKLTNAELLQIHGISVEEAVARYSNDPAIEYIEPDYEVHALLTPNDPRFPELYGLRNTGQTGGTPGDDIHATNAWDVFTGDPNIMVGVIDTGVDYTHPDLAANIWTNPGEIPGNGIDDDGNGYVDDVHGYDFVNNDGDPLDDHGHGTHCSGTIAGVGNNGIGVVGVNWHAKIVGMKFLNSGGSGSTSDAIRAVDYAVVVGVRLTSNSWGGGGFSQALLDAINAAGAAGQLFVAAAGNSSQNTDVTPSYPASYNTPYIIAVAATDHNDDLASFSNYGATTVDLAAPGVNILSTLPGNGYGTLSGTSMACPHVSGAVALTWGRYPALLNLQVKNLILTSVDVRPSLQGKVLTNGRLNAFMAIAEPDSIPPGMITDLATSGASSNGMILDWTATGDDGNTGRAARYEIRYSTGPINEMNFDSATLVPGPDPQPAGSAESWEVLGLDFNTTYYFAIRAFDEFNNQGPVSNVPTGTTLGIPDITASPTSFGTTLLSGATETQLLTLTNDGEGTLDFTVPAPNLLLGAPVTYEPLSLSKGENDPRPGILGSGGPDAFGYRWVDSDEPGGPTYAWEDITTTGTLVTLTGDDATSSPINMGISFPFYGNTFTSVRVCTNGFLSFTDASTAYGNQPLPNSGAPANLVAPLWMDLNFGTTQRAFSYTDGTKFVISWVGVPPYSGSGTATFQAILYPTGEIRYQYQSLSLAANGATVGLQNATKDVGLTVAFNTPYLHDNLAVRVAPVPQWLSVTPTSGRILAGQSMQLQVQFNAFGLLGGTYNSNVVVNSNDPDESEVSLPAELHVIGAPDIAVNPASLDFGQNFVGSTPTQNLIVSNPGTDDLTISGIVSSDPTLSASPAAFTLAPLAAQSVTVTYAPVAPSVLNATLTVLSNDPDQPSKVVTAVGSAVPAPDVSVTPTSFDVTLQTNTATSRTLRIDNTGGSPLTWTADPVTAFATGSVTVHDVPDLGKEEVDSNPGILGSGGPDVFGYSWIDSDNPGGPTFAWVDISGVGTPIYSGNADDSNRGPFPIGFEFPFYGNSFSTFRTSTNGFISFTSTSSDLSNAPLPGTGAPENLLAVFHDDMYVDADIPSQVYYYYDGAKLIVQFHNLRRYNQSDQSPPFYDVEALLYPNGSMVFQYQTVAASGNNSATIGIQNATRDDGLTVVYNANYVHDGLAIRFAPPARFLTVTPTSGTVPAGGFVNVMVGFNAAGLFGGDYEGAVHLTTNDPLLLETDVPSTLHVIGVPDIAASPASLDFGNVFIGYPKILELALTNIGTDDLVVTNIVAGNGVYGVDATNFTIPPLGNALVQVSFAPTSVAAYPTQLTITSNDPDSPNFMVPLNGAGIIAPDIAVSPTSMNATLNIPETDDQVLVLTNDGGSDLTFHMGAQLTAQSVPVYESLDLGKEEADPRPGILGTGGPDMFGYRWIDSDEPGGPMFNWVDITGVGTPIPFTGDDQNLGPFPISFSFPFYGNTFNSFRASSNGWVSFTNTTTDFSNDPLPGSGAPENLLAMFWDDLTFTSLGDAYYYDDGARFIISYVGVPRLGTGGGPYTFEVILYASGKIVYQYLDMLGTRLNEATVGIQNSTRDDGLTVVYNANYVHNGLAVEFRTIPDWMSMSPDEGTVPAHSSVNINVHIDTNGLFGGMHEGLIQIASNDPDEPSVGVPMHLTAIGTPDLAVSPTSLDFGDVYVGLSSDLDIQVANVGSDVLNISGASIDNSAYSLVGASFPIVLGERGSATLTVRFTPTGECIPCTGTLSFASNDPSSPLDVPLTGNGIIPPEIEVSPTSLKAALATTLGPTAIRKTKTLTVCNTGGSDLNFSLNAAEVLSTATSYECLDLAKDEVDPRPGILGTGGPDAFGYTWTDSDEPGGPTYNWVDISGVGTPVFGAYYDDRNNGPLDIGFSFPFYGNAFNQFRVCTNGWISFSSTLTTYTNQPLPNSGSAVPENLLAVFWDDMVNDPADGNEVYYYNDGSRLIVQYEVRRIAQGTPPYYSFEVILYPNGDIIYQYRTLGTTVNSATIGIQNATKDDGLTVVFNSNYVHENLAIRFASRPAWLTVDPTSGTVPAGECMTLNVTFDATGLDDGDYQGVITIASNDLTDPTVDVPCDLHVGVITASLDIDPASLNPKASGNWVKGLVELPAGHDVHAILIPSVLLQRTVPVDPNAPVSYTDLDGDMLEEANYKFDRASVISVVPSGDMVTIEAIGEEEDVTWFACTDVIRVLKPRVNATRTKASNEDSKTAWIVPSGSTMPLTWQDPEGAAAVSYQLWFSSDAGRTWALVAKDMTGHDYTWSVPEQETDKAILELAAYDARGFMGSWVSETFTIGKGGVIDRLPTSFGLRLAGPNPARSAALFSLAVPREGAVNVNVYDVKGALVRQLVRTDMAPGLHTLTWDGRDRSGHLVASGVYFVHMNAGDKQQTVRVLLMR